MDYSEDFSRDVILNTGDLFIDAGAHTGMWTVQASRFYKRVIAIEPTNSIVKKLNRNIRMNRLENVTVIPKALADSVGAMPFYRWPDGPMGNSLVQNPVSYSNDYGQGKLDGMIETVSIDSLEVDPTVVKLDVEGFEDKAIKGGIVTIRRTYPTLLVEIHRKENEEAIMRMLPDYSWERRLRHFSRRGKSEFDQVHLLGKPR